MSTSPSRTLALKNLSTNDGLTTYTSVIFDDAAGDAIFNAVTNPISESFQPEGQNGTLNSTIPKFSGFYGDTLGISSNGWTLTAFNSGASSATLGDVTLSVSATPVPFEFEGSAGILTIGAIWGVNQWRKNRIKK